MISSSFKYVPLPHFYCLLHLFQTPEFPFVLQTSLHPLFQQLFCLDHHLCCQLYTTENSIRNFCHEINHVIIILTHILLTSLQCDKENCEHLKFFRNVYCVTTNHSKDQDMQTSHKTTN